ncbi:hypothetical protein [Roseobacter sp. S98]|uniref:hypothetical protein n=1 Tax=Roseobacter algicola (ex Choi et al. 2025) (nom. illeg.) TaxID=3092138 RepID=UPI0035C68DF9
MRGAISAISIAIVCCSSFAHAQMVAESASTASSSGVFDTEASDYVENNGLAARVLFVSKSAGTQRTVSIEMRNTREEPIWLAVIGPPPNAVDTLGSTYSVVQIAGLATCQTLKSNSIERCMTNYSGYLPGSAFTSLAAGASSLVNLTLSAPEAQSSGDGFMSLTMSAALGVGDQPAKSGDRGLISIPISFPLIPLEAK